MEGFARPGMPTAGSLDIIEPGHPAFGKPVDVLRQNGIERLYWPLYSLSQITAATTGRTLFFQQNADIRVTNIERNGTLPKPQAFAGRAITVGFQPGVTVADAHLLMRSGVLEFQINNRLYFRLPIGQLGGAGGAFASGSGAAGTENVTLGLPTVAAAQYFPVPFILQGEEQFSVSIEWRLALAGLAANTDVTVTMLGLLQRKMTGQ